MHSTVPPRGPRISSLALVSLLRFCILNFPVILPFTVHASCSGHLVQFALVPVALAVAPRLPFRPFQHTRGINKD
ncbi:hypothetical protein BU24DRAFT_420732 [Aaosphaeria arxii CBS 175.79]|uniref:Uncharacterized protein n=1 Tax=Aaosphaeria arxii CBS 175.79 TaxID=1450172 RepID=A0A6A5XWH6_9PLEO|nr:uncharacterized protein BU24DRAFT_420732 [Aaosphaeria arxii CBS 175.79]KAF2017685.1 hypothetical protein BU24DRAFT_420732 [Aaosphaeria arxii CBS 175.79]